MERREIIVGVLLVILAGGLGAMTQVGAMLFPTHAAQMFKLGTFATLFAFVALTAFFFGQKPKPRVERPSSTTVISRGGGKIDLEDIESFADTLIDADGTGNISVKRGRHLRPSGTTDVATLPPDNN